MILLRNLGFRQHFVRKIHALEILNLRLLMLNFGIIVALTLSLVFDKRRVVIADFPADF
jgi:hypothetical protein